MLHQDEIDGQSSQSANLSSAEDLSDLRYLRKLLLGSEYQDLLRLQREFSDHSHASEKISQVISEAIAIRSKQDDSVSNALVPSLEDAIRVSAKRNPKRLANALFPVMGPAIRESVAETVGAMMQQVNQLLENSLSARSIKWRISALRTNRSFAEVMLAETVIYQVEQVFLIHRETSLLINHLTSENAIVKDPDMVSSMLTAVTEFVKDSFVVDKQQSVKSIKFGQLNLLFEAGPHAIIVVAVRGLIPNDLQITLREQIEELHRLYGGKLETYDGNAEQFPDTYEQLNKCLLSKQKDDESNSATNKKIPWPAIIALSLILLLPVVWWALNKIEQNKWNEIINQLQAEPGVIVLNHDKQDDGYIVNGLIDPLAKDPMEIISSREDFTNSVQFQMQPYYSSELDLVNKRLEKILNPPNTVNVIFDSGLLTIEGLAEPGWVEELPNKLPFIWGVSRVDMSKLQKIEDIQQKILQLIGSIEGVVIEFGPNSTVLAPNDLKSISNMLEDVKALQVYTTNTGKSFKLGILGFADSSGTSSANNEVSEGRARAVHAEFSKQGIIEENLLAKGLGRYISKSEQNRLYNCVSHRCVVFEVYLN